MDTCEGSDVDTEEDYQDTDTGTGSKKRKRTFIVQEKSNDPLPPKYRHVRVRRFSVVIKV